MSVGAVRESGAVFRRPPELEPARPAAAAQPPSPDTSGSPFATLLRDLERRVDGGEATLRGALAAGRAGQDVSLRELIAIQAGVYRYTETVDLVARLVDHATSGLKTVIQSQ
ncbi:MAG: hypothetical protein M3O36_02700 [Myxococcota bacterium]|nr:hypothetical protein [Myxococcota bacterium]